MARGKKGPVPDALDEPIEDQNPHDPTGEEVMANEEVVDLTVSPSGYICSQTGCKFTTPLLSDMEAHSAETGHGKALVEVQPELFSTPGVINREVQIPLDETLLNEKKTRLAKLYQSALDVKEEKKEADSDFNARLKNIDEQMQEIARVLAKPFSYEMVKAEWRIIEGENARGLFRLDTGEMIQKDALTMEDKVAEEAKAAADNAPAKACKVCGEDATAQIDGIDQFVCDRHALEGDVVRRLSA